MDYKKLDNKIFERCKNSLYRKFRSNGNIFNDINEILSDNIVITGSMIISGILNDHYYGETRYIDIDIFANHHDELYYELLYILNTSNVIRKKEYCKHTYNYNIESIVDYNIYNIYDIQNKWIIKIDLLTIDIKPSEFIKNTSDLNIVKNYYNGRSIYSLYHINLINHYENITHMPETEDSYYRIIKYVKRGFHFSIFHICINNLYINGFPFLYKFKYDVAREIIRKHIHKKNFYKNKIMNYKNIKDYKNIEDYKNIKDKLEIDNIQNKCIDKLHCIIS